jgi:tyrosyl-tRNA synthetase
MFGARQVPADILPSSTLPRGDLGADDASVPTSRLDVETLKVGIPAFKLFHQVGLANSGGAARRLIEQGGAYINGSRVASFDYQVSEADLEDGHTILLRSGKKRFHKIKVKK